jgi:hypothetical protein
MMNTYHTALWSDLSSSSSDEEDERYKSPVNYWLMSELQTSQPQTGFLEVIAIFIYLFCQ